jgi:molybdopterin-dependent oxidoreductase alpha subunit
MSRISKRWTPSNWASWKPFGIGEQRPNNYTEILRAISENRGELPYTWRILTQGVCDGCALGTTGLHDWTLDGIHLCNIRLRLLRLNTMGPLDTTRLGDVSALRKMTSAELRELGRLPWPMLRRRGERGFSRLSWDDALGLIAARMRETLPDRLAFYLTSRGMPNEAYYCAQKAARAIGTNNIDNAARVCHSPSTVALKEALGVGATTCSYSDWLSAQVIVFIGSNVANNQPVATKYLHYAKKNGARVLVVNPYREPGMERYWIPSVVESALFGTKLADRFYQVQSGGDVAFLNGVLKHLIATGRADAGFVAGHTAGFDELRADLEIQTWESLEAASGLPRTEMADLAERLGRADRAVFVWSMGVTQHVCGVENVRAIANLALARGFVGRDGCGLMPIRGHSGVQGGAEMGAYATALPGGVPVNDENASALGAKWGFPVPASPGLAAPEMIDAAHRGELEVLFSVGGNFLEVMPDPPYVEAGLEEIPLRVHMDLVLSTQMLVEPKDTVLLLPAATRYETPGGVTETTTERRVVFSPEIAGRRIAEARPEWEVFLDLARRVRPERAPALELRTTAEVRAEIARVVPFYDGIQRLAKRGDQFQYGGPHLCAGWHFPLPGGRARFGVVHPPSPAPRGERFLVTTRRGKQFNTMVHERRDAITGAEREAVLMNAADAARLGLRDGDPVRLTSETGRYEGRVLIAPIRPGDVQVHWPEGNVLLDRSRRAPKAGIPDFSASVRIEKTR